MPAKRATQESALALAVTLSGLGMAVHTVREFGLLGLWALETGMLPVFGVQLILLGAWKWVARTRTTVRGLLGITGVFQLVGGAILSVLPLPFLPFQPEQTIDHYLSHVILGVCQVPLILISFKRPRKRVDAQE
jgi:membrane-bound ClpP family serine protease